MGVKTELMTGIGELAPKGVHQGGARTSPKPRKILEKDFYKGQKMDARKEGLGHLVVGGLGEKIKKQMSFFINQ